MKKRFPVELEISSYCPLLCNVCINKDINKKSYMSDDDFFFAIDYVVNNLEFISILDISGIWDIFTHPNIEKYLRHIWKTFKYKDIFIIVPTKGTLMKQSHIDILEDMVLDGVNISLSLGIFSVHRKKHDLITGVPWSFDKTFTLVSKLRKTKIPFSIELAISEYTLKDVPYFKALCEKIWVWYEIIRIHSFAGSLDGFKKLQLQWTKTPNAECMENKQEIVHHYPNFHCARAMPTFAADGNMIACSHGRIDSNFMLWNTKKVLSRFKNHWEFLKFTHTEAIQAHMCTKCPAFSPNA